MNLSEIRTAISCNDILLVPCPSDLDSTSQADISINLDKLPCPFKASLPIINSPMDMVTSKELLTLLLGRNIPVTIHRYYDSPDKQLEFFNEVLKYTWGQYPETLTLNACNIFISVGSVFKWKEWIDALLNYRKVSNIKFGVLIDMANGDTKACIETVKYLRANCEDLNIMAGNVATKGGFTRLQSAGANLIRCGIGGGSCCSTRDMTSFGVPTLDSTMNCEERKNTAYLISDGGVETNADIVKYIRCGADLVMLGKKFAQTNLSPGTKLDKNKEFTENENEYAYCQYRGMSSFEARQASPCRKNSSVEGVSGYTNYTGTTENFLDTLYENLTSACAYYGGCVSWKEFRQLVKIVRITPAGRQESNTRLLHF